MHPPEQFVPFLGVVLLLTVTPGPDMALILRNGLSANTGVAWMTGLGCCTGIAAYALTSSLGMAALLASSPRAFDAVRYAGAVYLIYLGGRALQSALTRHRSAAEQGDMRRRGCSISRATAFRQGLISNLLNPKIALLFLTLIPQFIGKAEPRTQTTFVLSVTFLAIAVLWWSVFSLALHAAARLITTAQSRLWVERLTGVVLVALGVRILVG
ncbi:LysE family translocator [Streptomyces sp. WMMC500]|uniref:LysE family translocator n=1 Tax=Streptomyces sp. WMMC500 TaxID=3015154 RepID=UPI00248AF668|nr:LysE family translocator [Streptomyces sp. WMMC500]WBB62005.1 LysE family translocator [Streptomyces sp. WMMC500]